MQFYRSSNRLWVLNVALGRAGSRRCWRFQGSRRGCETWRRDWGESGSSRSACTWSCIWPSSSCSISPWRITRATCGCTPTGSRIKRSRNGSAIRSSGWSISMVVGFALAWVPYLLLARSPKRWWIYTTLLSVPFLFAGMLIKPIWIDPLFNRFGPMKNQALEQKILALAARAGIEGSRVFEVEKSVDTKAVNAYVTGVFATKRIVLWDTLLAKLDEKEVLHVMGHEMGHYVLGHVVRSIVLSAVLTLIGLFLVDWCGRRLVARYSDRLGFDRLSDVASVPLLLMLLEVAMFLLSPVALAYSRMQEHEADQFALELTHDNHAGARSFVKLQQENLSNPRPGPIFKFFRSSHPSIGERIDFCNSYRPWLESDAPPAHSEVERVN